MLPKIKSSIIEYCASRSNLPCPTRYLCLFRHDRHARDLEEYNPPDPMKRFFTYLWQHSRDTFSSLYVRNYRLYYIGQIISTSGTFMQSVAQAWLVLKLTNSGTALGITSALQYFPILVLGPYGGVIADRLSKRKILYFTQSISGI